jgi:hypothetical protein
LNHGRTGPMMDMPIDGLRIFRRQRSGQGRAGRSLLILPPDHCRK